MPYQKEIAAVEERLKAVYPDEKQRCFLAALLIAASNYGAGDALAGAMLLRVPKKALEQAAVLLGLENHVVRWGGAGQALLLLSATAKDPRVAALLKELDAAALAGTGWEPTAAPPV